MRERERDLRERKARKTYIKEKTEKMKEVEREKEGRIKKS